jgi:hypothetical protein
MTIIEQLESNKPYLAILKEGAKARIKYTGQVVELKRVSGHGISLVSFRTGSEYFISNRFLEPVSTLH